LKPDAAPGAVAVFAPVAGDAATLQSVLGTEDVALHFHADPAAFYAALDERTLAAVVTEEGLAQCSVDALDAVLRRQAAWSDLPILALAASDRGIDTGRFGRLAGIGNVTLLPRPTTREALLMAFRSALRARRLQFVVRDHVSDLEAAVAERTRSLEHEVQERRRVEQALAEARRLESLGRLTGGIAHDFNNMLQVILGGETLVRMFLGPALDARTGRALDGVKRAAEHGAALTQQLLAYARRQPLANIVLDLRTHLNATADLMFRAVGSHARLHRRVARGTWPVLVDPAQLDAALLNIVGNARDAMPHGGALLLAARNCTLPDPALPEAEGLEGDFVALTVTDDGEGMSEETARQAFEPFFTTKPVGKGTGLGLSQVYGFAIQSHGLAFIRRERVGTTVGILLPRADEDPAAEPAAPAARGGARLAGLHVLCVEDDPDVAATTRALLESLGATATLADSADAAVEADLDGIDVVLSDVMMPGSMDGIGLARWLAAHRPGLPVVLVSGYMLEPARLQGVAAKLVRKPFTMQELADALLRAAGRAPQRAPA
jgi:signal transduction histidine kinase